MIDEDSYHRNGADPIQAGEVRKTMSVRHTRIEEAFVEVAARRSANVNEQFMAELEDNVYSIA
jgi:hypothetical protein